MKKIFLILVLCGAQLCAMDPGARYGFIHNEGMQVFAAVAKMQGEIGRDKEPIGSLSYSLKKDGTAYIKTFLVLPKHRKRGIGGKLLDAAIEFFKTQGICSVSLHAIPLMADGATPEEHQKTQQRLYAYYAKYGFRQSPHSIVMTLDIVQEELSCTEDISSSGEPLDLAGPMSE